MARFPRPTPRHRAGSVAVEFALIGPLLIMLIMATIIYGSWFWLAQSVQTLASEGARAAVAGLDAAERERLAQGFIAAQASEGAGLDIANAVVTVESDAEAIRVRIAYDIQDHPIMAMPHLVPAPPMTIERTAVVRIGGY